MITLIASTVVIAILLGIAVLVVAAIVQSGAAESRSKPTYATWLVEAQPITQSYGTWAVNGLTGDISAIKPGDHLVVVDIYRENTDADT